MPNHLNTFKEAATRGSGDPRRGLGGDNRDPEFTPRRTDIMRAVHLSALGALGVLVALTTAASAQEIDWTTVDAAIGRTAAVSGDVHRYGFPRTDLTVTLDGVTIKPALALGSWAAFN